MSVVSTPWPARASTSSSPAASIAARSWRCSRVRSSSDSGGSRQSWLTAAAGARRARALLVRLVGLVGLELGDRLGPGRRRVVLGLGLLDLVPVVVDDRRLAVDLLVLGGDAARARAPPVAQRPAEPARAPREPARQGAQADPGGDDERDDEDRDEQHGRAGGPQRGAQPPAGEDPDPPPGVAELGGRGVELGVAPGQVGQAADAQHGEDQPPAEARALDLDAAGHQQHPEADQERGQGEAPDPQAQREGAPGDPADGAEGVGLGEQAEEASDDEHHHPDVALVAAPQGVRAARGARRGRALRVSRGCHNPPTYRT